MIGGEGGLVKDLCAQFAQPLPDVVAANIVPELRGCTASW